MRYKTCVYIYRFDKDCLARDQHKLVEGVTGERRTVI
jgi:hypothetical protein